MRHFHRSTRLSGLDSVYPSHNLNTGFLICNDNKLILSKRFIFPIPVIEIENSPGFGGKIRVSRENPVAMLPGFDDILMQLPHDCAATTGSCQNKLLYVTGNIFRNEVKFPFSSCDRGSCKTYTNGKPEGLNIQLGKTASPNLLIIESYHTKMKTYDKKN
jgi:hypothetical protein